MSHPKRPFRSPVRIVPNCAHTSAVLPAKKQKEGTLLLLLGPGICLRRRSFALCGLMPYRGPLSIVAATFPVRVMVQPCIPQYLRCHEGFLHGDGNLFRRIGGVRRFRRRSSGNALTISCSSVGNHLFGGLVQREETQSGGVIIVLGTYPSRRDSAVTSTTYLVPDLCTRENRVRSPKLHTFAFVVQFPISDISFSCALRISIY